jgi:uncharacterized membrane protein
VGFLAVGVIFFFAYNWASLHRFGKLGLLASGIAFGVIAAWKQGLDTLASRCALSFASVMVGGFLAVMGQIYQSGADAYQLFLLWTLLIAGWVWVSEFAVLLGFWIFLWNLTVALWFAQSGWLGSESAYFRAMSLIFLNLLALASWEMALLRGVRWLETWGRWAQRLLFGASLFFLTVQLVSLLGLRYSFEEVSSRFIFMIVLYALFWAGAWAVYARWRLDLFILASLCLSFFIFSSMWFVRYLNSANAFFWLSLLILGEVILSVWWLRWLHQQNATKEQK